MSVASETIAAVAGTVGHELRNPLAAAVAGVTLACEMLDENDPRRTVLNGALLDLDRVCALLDSYLDLARTGHARRSPCDLGAICQTVAARHPDVVRIETTGEPVVLGDAHLLGRAVENLVENALQAGARNIAIRTHDGVGTICVDVEDDGPGVPAELLTRVFEPGFSRRGGTGLGLCIVAATARAHGGTARCERRHGRGSRFSIELPAAIAVDATEAVHA